MPVSSPFNILSGGDSQTTPSGGTVVGTTGITASQVAIGAATANTIKGLADGTAGQLLASQGAGVDPIWVTATGGAGDFNGPASSTDNAIVRFDGIGGKTGQNSTITVSDAGVIAAASGTLTLTTPDIGAATGTSLALTGLAKFVQTGASGALVEGTRITNLTTDGGVYLNLNETTSTATPAYIARYGSTHATRANVLEFAGTAGPMWLNTPSNVLIGTTYAVPSGANLVVSPTGTGPGSQIQFGPGGFLISMETHEGMIAGGAKWVQASSPDGWTAVDPHPSIIRLNSTTGGMDFCVDSGLTIGATFTPTKIATVTTTGVAIGSAENYSKLDVAGGVSIGSYGGTTGAPTNGLIVSGNVGFGVTTSANGFTLNNTRLLTWKNNAGSGEVVGIGSGSSDQLNLITGGSNRIVIASGGDVTISSNVTVSGTGTQAVGGVASRLVLQGGTADTPASAAAAGTAGSVVWDASFIYVCTATNTWKRVAIATW